MSKFYMAITFLVLPLFWIKSQWLRRFGSPTSIRQEVLSYPRYYLGVRGIKIVMHGLQPDPKIPAIYVSNHQSMNDIFVALGSVNRSFRFIAKRELFENIITGTFMKLTQSYPLDRDDQRQSLKVLKQVIADVEQGASVLAFPEGTRSRQKEMLPFKDGIFAMLKRAKAPIVPMYIKESYIEKNKEIHVYFGDALLSESYEDLNGKALSETVFKTMNALKDTAYETDN